MPVTTVPSAVLTGSSPELAAQPVAPSRRWTWWGVAAGVTGFVATVVTDGWPMVGAERIAAGGADRVVSTLQSSVYHLGVVAGFATVAALLVLSAAWRRWTATVAPGSLAASVAGTGLATSSAAMMLAFGLKGALAVYLPGGMDDGKLAKDALYVMFSLEDAAPFLAWWGVAVTAACFAVLGIRGRVVPRWVALVSAVYVAVPLGSLLYWGEPDQFGLFGGIWLVLASVGLLARRRSRVPLAV
jgi:hypothetical protein